MKKASILALLLTVALLIPSARAAEDGDWLVAPTRDAPAFTDTAGTICETAAQTCYQAGLMDGVTSRSFQPTSGLTHAQIIVISARLHRLLTGGTLDYFVPISLTGADWWRPYDGYLREQLPALASDTSYDAMTQSPTSSCYRGEFLSLLSAVLTGTGTTLPERNDVSAVPDCQDPDLIAFYRWGVLNGKDAYGTLEASAPLTRGAAAAMLARLIDPQQRLTATIQPLDLCQELLGVAPETELLTIGGQTITAELFVPTLVGTCSSYNHSHFAAMMLEQNGRSTLDEALDTLRRYVWAQIQADGLSAEAQTVFTDGYRGLTAQGQSWTEQHGLLYQQAVASAGAPEEADLPQVTYLDAWASLDLSEADQAVASLPYWGGSV